MLLVLRFVPTPHRRNRSMTEASRYLEGLIEVLVRTRSADLDAQVEAAIAAIVKALGAGKPLLVCGNGASAADALHIAANLVGRYAKERPGLRVIPLVASGPFLTAWANDYAYESVFARQVEAYGAPGAAILGISTSGNSKNIVAAFDAARKLDMATIGMTGHGGGTMAKLSDVLIAVESKATPRIQEAHVALYHYLCEQVELRCAGLT
jgi:D-sedoheptulose 7-phosphate isomerase